MATHRGLLAQMVGKQDDVRLQNSHGGPGTTRCESDKTCGDKQNDGEPIRRHKILEKGHQEIGRSHFRTNAANTPSKDQNEDRILKQGFDSTGGAAQGFAKTEQALANSQENC